MGFLEICINRGSRTVGRVSIALLTFLISITCSAAASDLALGERIYREGILPAGAPMQAYVKGDVAVSGTAFSCVSCHMRSGLGSVEGGIVTTPTNGKSLYQPRNAPLPVMPGMGGSGGAKITQPPRRSAYTDETLAAVLRGGVDPNGRKLDDVMPRYHLGDEDMKILVAYLKSLSATNSPGIANKTLHLATVITADVPQQQVEAMVAPLETYVSSWNRLAGVFEKNKTSSQSRMYAKSNRVAAYQKIVLSRWVLKGPEATWPSQLANFYRQQPAFALVGGITTGDWKTIHQFCESNRIPSLFPQTDFPVISETDWYTVYLSKGHYQEGEAAARNLVAVTPAGGERALVQVIRDSRQGRALAAGFLAGWREAGRSEPPTVVLKEGELLSANPVLLDLLRQKPAALILWDGPGLIKELSALAAVAALPELLLASSSYVGNSLWTVPDALRSRTHFTYPYRLPQDEEMHDRLNEPMKKDPRMQGDARLIAKKSIAAVGVLNQALFAMKEDLFRDYFLDIIAMIRDLEVPLYERISFGPGQRYAAKGCYIVTLSPGPKPALVRKSEWVSY